MRIGGIRRSVFLLVAGALLVGLTVGCGRQPDTTLDPDPPAVTYTPSRHPFKNARLYVDRETAAARWQATNGGSWLAPITSRPQARWLNGPEDLPQVPSVVTRAQAQDTLPVFVAYYIPNRGCANSREGAPSSRAYERYIDQLVARLGDYPSVIILEPDALAADCFDAARAKLLANATRQLAAAGHYVYIDAGHARWRPTGETAQRLLASGITHAEGFAVNVANRQTTQESYRWGRELSDLVGDREFVIDTSRNGSGPPPDEPNRDDEWCNPQQQALGTPPRPVTDRVGLAALLWIKAPGESDGKCGGEQTYLFSPTQARTLIVNADWLPAANRAAARAARPRPVTNAG